MKSSELLAPWEYEGEVTPEVIGLGELSYEGSPIQFELLKQGADGERFVFRRGQDDGSWTVPSLYKHLSFEWSVARLPEFLGSKNFVREFWFDSEQMRIFPKGRGVWGTGGPVKQHDSLFSLGKRVEKLTSSQTHDWLLALLSRPSSDVSFARRFKQSSIDQRWSQVFGFATEEELLSARANMRALCSRVLYAAATLWHQQSSINWTLIASRDHLPSRFLIYSEKQHWGLSTAYTKRWAGVLEQFGSLHPNPKRMCLREFFDSSPVLSSGQLDAPSYHEQLEARLFLREWGRKHLPPDVWAELERAGS